MSMRQIGHMMSPEISMQTRRLQVSGGSTFVISLPKAWVEGMRLKAGDGVLIMRNANKSLTFMPDEGMAQEAECAIVEISPGSSDESVRRKIIAIYLAGYKSIRIVSKGMELRGIQAGVIRSLIRSTMIGTEIVESDSRSISIQILTRLPELTFGVALKRMRLMTTNMHREAMDALAACNSGHAKEVVSMDDEIDRFALYMLRNLTIAVQSANMLHDLGLKRPSDCLVYRTAVSRIERIADHAVLIAKRVADLRGPVSGDVMREIIELSEDSLGLFERSVESLVRCDYQMAEDVADCVPATTRRQEEIMSGLGEGDGDSLVVKFVLDSIRRTAEYSSDIAEVVMDKNIRSVITEA